MSYYQIVMDDLLRFKRELARMGDTIGSMITRLERLERQVDKIHLASKLGVHDLSGYQPESKGDGKKLGDALISEELTRLQDSSDDAP